MFMFELLNSEVPKIIDAWVNSSIYTRDYDLLQNEHRTYIRWLYSSDQYINTDFIAIVKPIRNFIETTQTPFIFLSEALGDKFGIYDTNLDYYLIYPESLYNNNFKWSEQIERYRVALLLKTTE